MDPLSFAITAVGAVALAAVAIRTFLVQVGGKDAFLGRRKLEIRETGFAAREYDIEIAAELVNTGGADAPGTVVEAVLDGEVVASSTPLDLVPGQSGHVRLAIPRRYVTDVEGERPVYRGELALRVAPVAPATRS